VSRNVEVTLLPSNAQLGAVPDVVGDGKSPTASVRQKLAAAGYTGVAADYCVKTSSDKVGRVVSTQPAAGTAIRKTDGIGLGIGTLKC
jgi:beta-lactam-binding protein with PASTA domain